MPGADGQPVQLSNTAQRIPSSEGILQGFVLDARSGRPVTAATVDVIGAERTTTASTDNEGRYAVDTLPSGEYRVQARARGYVPAYYGQRDAADRSAAVDVRAGRLTRGIDVRLMPAGTVSGRVFDDRGDGLAGVEIELVGERYGAGRHAAHRCGVCSDRSARGIPARRRPSGELSRACVHFCRSAPHTCRRRRHLWHDVLSRRSERRARAHPADRRRPGAVRCRLRAGCGADTSCGWHADRSDGPRGERDANPRDAARTAAGGL